MDVRFRVEYSSRDAVVDAVVAVEEDAVMEVVLDQAAESGVPDCQVLNEERRVKPDRPDRERPLWAVGSLHGQPFSNFTRA